jgi:hypothetical protein
MHLVVSNGVGGAPTVSRVCVEIVASDKLWVRARVWDEGSTDT